MFSAAQAPRREPPERFAGFLPKSRRLRHGRKERQRKAWTYRTFFYKMLGGLAKERGMQYKLLQRKPLKRFSVFPKSGCLRHVRKERQRKAGSESVNMPDVLLQDAWGSC